MPRYRNSVNGVVAVLPDGHSVALGSDWVVEGEESADPSPAPKARRRRAKPATDE